MVRKRTFGSLLGTAVLATTAVVASPGTHASAATGYSRLAAYAAVPIVQAQAGVNTTVELQRAASAKVAMAAHQALDMISAAGAPAAAQAHAQAVSKAADALAGLTDTTEITSALAALSGLSAQSVQDFLWVPGNASVPLDVSSAPELTDQLTIDPEEGVVPACFVMVTGCYETGHGNTDSNVAPSSNYVGTTVDLPPILNGDSNRQPSCTTAAGMRVRVIYGYYTHSGAPGNRLSSYYKAIATTMAELEDNVNATASAQGGAKHIRFQMNSDCTLNVPAVLLPQTAYPTNTSYSGYNAMVSTLAAAGYKSTTTKYIVMTDNPNSGGVYCGLGTVYNDSRPDPALNQANGHSTTVAYAQVPKQCWDDKSTDILGRYTGNPYLGSDAAMHEFGHTIGAVQPTSPYSTAGFHCYDGMDRMCYNDGSARSSNYSDYYCQQANATRRWDCGADDYFARSPAAGTWLASHWNLYKSGFLY